METKHYTLSYSKEKNRVYVKQIGFWNDVNIANEFISKCDQLLQSVRPGFTAVIDLSEFKIPKPAILEIIKEAQAHFKKAKLEWSAEIVSENIFTEVAIKKISTENHLEKRQKFSSLTTAENWLDKQTNQ